MNVIRHNRSYLLAMCAHAVCVATALLLLPGAPFVSTLAAVLVITFVVTLAYRYTPAYTKIGERVLIIVSTVLAIGVVANVCYFTTKNGGTCDMPILYNSDSSLYWQDMSARYGVEGCSIVGGYVFFGEINAVLLKVFGYSIVVPILANMVMMLGSLVLASMLTYNLTNDKKTSTIAMCSAACVCYYMCMGTILLKDAWVIFFSALAAYGLTLNRRYAPLLVLAAAIVMMAVKPAYNMAILVGVLIMGLTKPKEQRNYAWTVVLLVACVALWYYPRTLGIEHIGVNTMIADTPSYGAYYNYGHPQHQAYYNMLGNFFDYPLIKRILMLPVTAVVQFLVPFPWNYMRDVIFGYTQLVAHFAYPWYLFGFVVLYYVIYMRKKMSREMFMLTLWALFCWLTPCVMFGGTVSRYMLPTVTLFAPCVGGAIANSYQERKFARFMTVFAVLVAITLPICYKLQTSSAL